MGRSFSGTRGRSNSVVLSLLNATVQARQLRNAALNGVIQGEVIKTASLNAFTSLATQYERSAALNANVSLNSLLNGLQSYWTLDGDSADTLGANDGVDTSVTYSTGKINNGATFPLSGSKIVVGSASALDLTNLTISAWVNSPNFSNYYTIFGKGYGSGNTNYHFIVFPGGTMYLLNDSNSGPNANLALSTSTWQHVVVTRTSGNVCAFYIDGVPRGGGTGGAISSYSTSPNHIGSRADAYSVWPGTIDEVGIWNRVLTGGEITSLYNAGAGIQYPF